MADEILIKVASIADLKGVGQMARAIKDLNAQIKGVGTVPKTSDPFKGLAADAIKAEKAVIGLAQAQAKLDSEQAKAATSAQRLATEQARTAQATQRYTTSVAQAAAAQARAEMAGIRLVQAKERVAKSADSGTSALSKFGGKALEIAGGIGIATSAAELLAAAGDRVKDGFNLAKSIDQTRATLEVLTGSQERASQAFSDGEKFADRYSFKISEINTALGSLGPLMNTSTTSTEKQLEVLARLQTLGVGKTFEEAAFSAKELASGDYVSIVEQFNLSKTAAAGLRDEIAAGADVFEVLDRYLTSVNVTTGVLETRTTGAAGAANDFAKSQEDLNLALGRMAQGPGVQALDLITKLTNGLTSAATAGQQGKAFNLIN